MILLQFLFRWGSPHDMLFFLPTAAGLKRATAPKAHRDSLLCCCLVDIVINLYSKALMPKFASNGVTLLWVDSDPDKNAATAALLHEKVLHRSVVLLPLLSFLKLLHRERRWSSSRGVASAMTFSRPTSSSPSPYLLLSSAFHSFSSPFPSSIGACSD